MGWKFWVWPTVGDRHREQIASLQEQLIAAIGDVRHWKSKAEQAEKSRDETLSVLIQLVKENEVAALNRHRYLLRRLGAIENKVWRKKELDPIDKPSPSEAE